MEIDVEYAVHRLIKQYSGPRGCWGEHPDYSLDIWQSEVERCHTGLGYWHWVVLQIASEPADNSNSLEAELKLGFPQLNVLLVQVGQNEDRTLRAAACIPANLREDGTFEKFPFETWVKEALSNVTRLGYLSWLAEQIRNVSCHVEEAGSERRSGKEGRGKT